MALDLASLPDPASAQSALEMARSNGVSDDRHLDLLARVAGLSRVLGRFLARKPDSLARLSRDPSGDLLARARECRAALPLHAALRDFRNTETARALGLERSHLYKKCQQLGIDLKAQRANQEI